jgi:hypothetical protein
VDIIEEKEAKICHNYFVNLCDIKQIIVGNTHNNQITRNRGFKEIYFFLLQ